MKNSFVSKLLILIFFSFIFFSCKNSKKITGITEYNIKDYAMLLNESIDWTEEIDGEILTRDINYSDGFDQRLRLSINSYFLGGKELSFKEIKPSIPNFANLDISAYDKDVLDIVKSFCESILKSEDAYENFNQDFLHSYVVFDYNLKSLIKENGVLVEYILGEPFVSEKVYQCPVRFFYEPLNEKNDKYEYLDKFNLPYFDLLLYLDFLSSEWKISQIDFRN